MINIDEKEGVVTHNGKQFSIGSPEAFKLISDVWLRSGWDTKYVYSFSWLGRPIIQLPEDMMRIQEVIFDLKPDVIIETGIAHGGSLIFYASLCKMIGKGHIVGIDIEIRPHNRKAIEEHFLYPMITMIEGSAIDPSIVDQVAKHVKPTDTVLVLLDSNHTYDHVLEELNQYSKFVSKDSYIVATDGIMEYVVGAPRTQPDWITNNPKKAAEFFVTQNEDFVIQEPEFPFNEGEITERVTYWPSAFIKKIK